MDEVRAAKVYNGTDDLWIITTYFNSAGFKTKRLHYQAFAETMAASNLHLITVECAFGSEPFELPAAPDVIQLRAKDVMWQKERMVNYAMTLLPKECKKICWSDFDIFFENANWAVEAVQMLDQYPLVQTFGTGIWLPPNTTEYLGKGKLCPSFAAVYKDDPTKAENSDFEGIFFVHGHPGFVWAARREVLEATGVYDACIVGGADHAIAHAAVGNWRGACMDRSLALGTAHFEHYQKWAEAFYREVKGNINYVPGNLLHRWHGHWRDRQYNARNSQLREFGFDPNTDLKVDAEHCWQWATDKPAMHHWLTDYFVNRKEDDQTTFSATYI